MDGDRAEAMKLLALCKELRQFAAAIKNETGRKMLLEGAARYEDRALKVLNREDR